MTRLSWEETIQDLYGMVETRLIDYRLLGTVISTRRPTL